MFFVKITESELGFFLFSFSFFILFSIFLFLELRIRVSGNITQSHISHSDSDGHKSWDI